MKESLDGMTCSKKKMECWQLLKESHGLGGILR